MELSWTSWRDAGAPAEITGGVGNWVLRPNPAQHICLSAHISCLSFLSSEEKLHSLCVSNVAPVSQSCSPVMLAERGVVLSVLWFVLSQRVQDSARFVFETHANCSKWDPQILKTCQSA